MPFIRMKNASTLLSFAYSNQMGSVGSVLTSAGDYDFADAMITDLGNAKNTASEFKDGNSLPVERTHVQRRISNFPVARMEKKRRNFQETSSWEGVVTQVSDEGVIAKLCRRYQDFPAEEALIPWDEIDPADRPLAKEGASFSWKVGYLDIGQRLSVSHIEFRRMPNFSAREQAAAMEKAAEYSALFND
jgi:hypothetical protein